MFTIFLILCIAAEAFFFYSFFCFTREAGFGPRGSQPDFGGELVPSKIAPLHFVASSPVATWSQATWDHFLCTPAPSRAREIEGWAALPQAVFAYGDSACSKMPASGAFRLPEPRSDVVDAAAQVPAVRHDAVPQKVFVIASAPTATITALRTASRLAGELGAQVALISMERIPWRFPLQKPPVSELALERKLYTLVYDAGIVEREVRIQLCLCRDLREGLRTILPPHSLVVIGEAMHWWSMRERILKALLTRLGHRVIVSERHPVVAPTRPLGMPGPVLHSRKASAA